MKFKFVKRVVILSCIFGLSIVNFIFAQTYDISKATSIRLVSYYSSNTTVDDMDTVTFGLYPQNDASGSTKEPIEWVVLDRKSDKVLLLSKYVLDCKCYNDDLKDVTWETSTLREWLNLDFLNNAFNDNEQNCIIESEIANHRNYLFNTSGGNNTIDKVFVLSSEELKLTGTILNTKYFMHKNNLETKATNYAKNVDNGGSKLEIVNQNVGTGRIGNCSYWLRTPAYNKSSALSVGADGWVEGAYHKTDGYELWQYNVDRKIFGVRPAIWISTKNLKSLNNSFDNNINSTTSSKKYADLDLNIDNASVLDIEKYGKKISDFDEDTQKWIREHAEQIDVSGNNGKQNNDVLNQKNSFVTGGTIAGLPSRESELRSDNHFYLDNNVQKSTWVYYVTYYYHVDANGNIEKSKWIEQRYVGADGRMYRGRKTPDGKWVGDNGLVVDVNADLSTSITIKANEPDSWYKTQNGLWYYFENDRTTTKKGWFHDKRDDQWYYLDPATGIMAVGWTNIDGSMYYFNESHENEPNWYEVGGGFYECYNKKVKAYGSMFCNEQTPDGQYVDENGKLASLTTGGNNNATQKRNIGANNNSQSNNFADNSHSISSNANYMDILLSPDDITESNMEKYFDAFGIPSGLSKEQYDDLRDKYDDGKDSANAWLYFLCGAKLAILGHDYGWADLGRSYANGNGVPENGRLAILFYDRAISKKERGSYYLAIGRIYYRGSKSVFKDSEMARYYFEKALELGDNVAQYWLDKLDEE